MRLRSSAWLFAPCLVACATPTAPPEPEPRVATAPRGTGPTELPSASSTVAATPAPSASVATPSATPRGPLSTFHAALHALEDGTREDHVRIVWLGDSHAQADFWPHAIRNGLQKRFGRAGPGFVHFGMRHYRHADVKLDLGGKWRMRPKSPSTIEPWGDGAFGLGGILHAGFAGQRVAILQVTDPALEGKRLRWDLCVKPGLPEDELRLSLTGKDEQKWVFRTDEAHPVGAIRHMERFSDGPAVLKAVVRNGRPDFCGVVVETDTKEGKPGVVLDNLGINGARYATALAWNEEAWAVELRRRPPPELFIFEYGGNEASDIFSKPAQYEQDALALIARTKKVRPDASCLVIAPSDREDAEVRIPPIVEAVKRAAEASGCAFWNTYEIMGGRGSLRTWRETERAAPDGIHLKPKGYEEVGRRLLADLMADYRR